ncbi:MAG: biopolymer transporter ExbD [Pirellulales bacterium]
MAGKRKKTEGSDIDMTPMIDVTFQLITFFMFTMNFTEAEQDQRIQLPTSQVAKPVENSDIDPLTLQLMEDGRVIYNGEPVALLALGDYLENEKAVMLAASKEPSAATVVVRADGRAKTGEVQQIIRSCQEKGFDKFVLRAEYKGP